MHASIRGDTTEYPGQFCVSADMGLNKYRGLLRFYTGCDEKSGELTYLGLKGFRFLGCSNGMKINNAKNVFKSFLQ